MAEMSREQERAELYKAIWGIANDLRGSVDGWDFKQYVLGAMFYRYVSENLTDYINKGEREAGNTDFDYAQMSDEDAAEARDGLIEEKGFFLYPSELFCNVVEHAKDDENLNETLERIFKNIEDSSKGTASEKDFSGLFDDFDVNSNKLGATVAQRNDKLVKLLTGIASMNLKGANNDLYSDKNNILDALQLLKESLDGADANIADRMKKCIDARQFDEIKSFADLSSGIHNLVEVLSVYDVYSSNEHYPDGFTISNTTRSIECDKEVHLDMDLKKTSPYRIRIGNDTYDNPSEAWTSLVEIVVDVLSAKNQSKMMMLVHDFTARKSCCLSGCYHLENNICCINKQIMVA